MRAYSSPFSPSAAQGCSRWGVAARGGHRVDVHVSGEVWFGETVFGAGVGARFGHGVKPTWAVPSRTRGTPPRAVPLAPAVMKHFQGAWKTMSSAFELHICNSIEPLLRV